MPNAPPDHALDSCARADGRPALPAGVLAVRSGPGANCSSIGSVVDVLFGAAVVGGALYALIAATLAEREESERGRPPASSARRDEES